MGLLQTCFSLPTQLLPHAKRPPIPGRPGTADPPHLCYHRQGMQTPALLACLPHPVPKSCAAVKEQKLKLKYAKEGAPRQLRVEGGLGSGESSSSLWRKSLSTLWGQLGPNRKEPVHTTVPLSIPCMVLQRTPCCAWTCAHVCSGAAVPKAEPPC